MQTARNQQASLVSIAERASSLEERRSTLFIPINNAGNDDLVRLRLRKWREIAGLGDENLFKKRLHLESIDEGDLPALLGDVRLREDAEPPPWIETFRELIGIYRPNFPGHRENEHPVPFQEVLFPFARYGVTKLRGSYGELLDLLSSEALYTLEWSLLQRLSDVCSKPLVLELNVARLLGQLTGDTPQARYADFLRGRFSSTESALHFFNEYAVTGKLVAILFDDWLETCSEFLVRLRKDLQQITQFFAPRTDLGKVATLRDCLSDPHCQGRTTKQLTFESGLKILYNFIWK